MDVFKVFLLPDEQQGGIHTRPVWQARVSGVFNVMKAHWVSKGYIQPSHVRLQTGRVDERLNLEISVTLRILPITSQERSSDWNKRRGGDFEYLPPVSPRPACLPPPSATHNCNRGICSCTGGDASTETFKHPDQIQIKPMLLLRDMFLAKCDEFFQFRCNSYMK